MHKIKLNGCIPSPRDDRDYRLVCAASASPPRRADLRSLCSAVEDQSSLNSCTANAAVGAMEILERKQQIEQLDLSRLFVYWNTRVLDGTTNQDPGAYLRSSLKAVETKGACLESIWPYNNNMVLARPSDAAYVEEKRQAVEYLRATQGVGVRQAMADGFPVIFGMLLSESFMSARFGGNVPMPRAGEQIIGGHAMLIVGYDMDARTYIVRNSWGEHWGDKGYCYIPFALVDDPETSFDFWVIRSMEMPISEDSQIVRPGKEKKIKDLKRRISRLKRRIRRTPRRMRGRRARMLREIRRLRRQLKHLERRPAR